MKSVKISHFYAKVMGGGFCPPRGVPRRAVRIVSGGRGVGYSLRQEGCVFVSGGGMPPAGRAPPCTFDLLKKVNQNFTTVWSKHGQTAFIFRPCPMPRRALPCTRNPLKRVDLNLLRCSREHGRTALMCGTHHKLTTGAQRSSEANCSLRREAEFVCQG